MAKLQIKPILALKKHQPEPYHYLSPASLLMHGGGLTTSSKIDALFRQQKTSFPFLQSGLQKLLDVQFKSVLLDNGLEILVQLNERRVRNVQNHQKAVESGRPCFLCSTHQQPEERAIYFDEQVSILTNPNPCLKSHLVISHNAHQGQSFFRLSDDAFALAKILKKDHFIFFNGSNVGASAPDHAHLQAASRDMLPLEKWYDNRQRTNQAFSTIFRDTTSTVCVPHQQSFSVVIIEGSQEARIRELTATVLIALDSIHAQNCSIVISYQDHSYRAYIFPRAQYRPSFFSPDPQDTLAVGVSPAALEMMGILITPFKKDFDTIDQATIERIYKEVSPAPQHTIARLQKAFGT